MISIHKLTTAKDHLSSSLRRYKPMGRSLLSKSIALRRLYSISHTPTLDAYLLERSKPIGIKDPPSPHDKGKLASKRTARLAVLPNLTNRHSKSAMHFAKPLVSK